MTSDKRRVKRISVELPVTVCLFDRKGESRIGEPLAGHVTNFSPIGAALTVASILLDGQHLFYTCHDNPNLVLQLEFELSDTRGKVITVPATPVWFDRDRETDKKQFVIGLKFLANAKSQEIKILSTAACKDEKRLVSLWKKLF